jgi:hypothetical protein
MRMLSRSVAVMAIALGLGATSAAAQQAGSGAFRWYVGANAGAFNFRTTAQSRSSVPMGGAHMLVTARRTGLLLSVEQAFGDGEQATYDDFANGFERTATFDNVRKYSATLLAMPLQTAIRPYVGLGVGIMQVVNPQPSGAAGEFERGDAATVGSNGFLSLLGGAELNAGAFTLFGQYQLTSGSTLQVARTGGETGDVTAAGRMIHGVTHTISGGLRLSLGGAREGVSGGGY